MQIFNIKDMHRGWFIGDFVPCVFQTEHFEVGYLRHKKGEIWDQHYHKLAIEINYLIKGKMKINNYLLNTGDLFIIDKEEISCPEFLEDCELIVVKVPSVKNDKYIV